MALSLMVGIGMGICGFIAGALSRQPEINELKQQVKSLQAEVERLHGLIEVQDNQIRELKIRYTALKGWSYARKQQERGYIRGSIMYQYALKEYLEMLIDADQSNTVHLNKQEIHFYNAFGKMLDKGEVTDNGRSTIIKYISEKYESEINRFQEPDLSSVMEYLE